MKGPKYFIADKYLPLFFFLIKAGYFYVLIYRYLSIYYIVSNELRQLKNEENSSLISISHLCAIMANTIVKNVIENRSGMNERIFVR